MTPASRRAGLVAGLVLALVCALGFAHRNTGDIADQCRAEMEAREAKDAELESARAAHAAEMDAVNRRIANLESELAREREHREAADGRAAAAARPEGELEAAREELKRAYARIGELERDGQGVWCVERKQIDAVGALGGRDPEDVNAQIRTKGTEIQVRDTAVLTASNTSGEIRTIWISGNTTGEKPAEYGTLFVIEKKEEPSAMTAIAPPGEKLNQGVDYVDPATPQSFEGGLNQGTSYVDPYENEEKLKKIRCLVEELKNAQEELQTVTTDAAPAVSTP